MSTASQRCVHPTLRAAGLASLAAAGLAVGGPAGVSAAAAAPATPKPVELMALTDPEVRLAGGEGHLVATRAKAGGGSELVELVVGQSARVVRTFSGEVSLPTVGRDAAGKAVVVVSPCERRDRMGLPRPAACSLEVVHISDGSASKLPRSAAAYAGAIDRGTVVVARRSATAGTRIAFLPAGGGAARPLPLDAIAREGFRDNDDKRTRVLDGLDLSGGVVAATVHVFGYSALVRSDSGRPWQLLARSGYGEASGVPRVFRAPAVDRRGVRAFYDGGDNDAGFAARWNAAGKEVERVPTARFGVPLVDPAAAWNGDRLVVASFRYGEDDDDPDTGPGVKVTTHGPIGLR